jgi:plastocyanin
MRPGRSLVVRAAVVAVVVAIALVLAGCGGSSTGPRDASPVDSGAVTMINNEFQPPHIQVPARTTVTWTNGDQGLHNVKFDDDPSSDNLPFGATFQRVFNNPGTFDYRCTIHPGMVGRVTVVTR